MHIPISEGFEGGSAAQWYDLRAKVYDELPVGAGTHCTRGSAAVEWRAHACTKTHTRAARSHLGTLELSLLYSEQCILPRTGYDAFENVRRCSV